MVRVIDHSKHVITKQVDQAKKLQVDLKKVEAAIGAIERAKASAKKSLTKAIVAKEEAVARANVVEAKLGVVCRKGIDDLSSVGREGGQGQH